MQTNGILSGKLKSFHFRLMDPEEVRRISVVQVTNSDTRGKENGLFDLRMGPYRAQEGQCTTCGKGGADGTFEECPGHFGRIELSAKIYNSLFSKTIGPLLRVVCHKCGGILLDTHVRRKFSKIKTEQLPLLYIASKLYNTSGIKKGTEKCQRCGALPDIIHSSIRDPTNKFGLVFNSKLVNPEGNKKEHLILAEEAYDIFNKISDDDAKYLGFGYHNHPRNLIISNLLVVPPMLRPMVFRGEDGDLKSSESTLTTLYTHVISANKIVANKRKDDTDYVNELIHLSYAVRALFTTVDFGKFPQITQTRLPTIGVDKKGLMETIVGKFGVISGNMMGKRVDNCARSVISADASLDIDQVGIPKYIAKTLTYPEIVTPVNINRLSAMVLRGMDGYPGANEVISGRTGIKTSLGSERISNNIILSPGDIVERHLINDDIVILTRQPSLNKNAFLSFRVFIVQDYSIRLSIAVVEPFNADFDGDEMNMFVPRTLEAVIECKELMGILPNMVSESTGFIQILPTQDTVIAVAHLTQDDTKFSYDDIMHVFAFREDPTLRLLEPDIDDKYWSGRRVFSMLLPKINFVGVDSGYESPNPNDKRCVVEQGQLLQGVITKKQLVMLTSTIYHTYSDKTVAFNMVNDLNKMTNRYLRWEGITFGFNDIYIKDPKVKTLSQKSLRLVVENIESKIEEMMEGQVIYPIGVKAQDYLESISLQRIQGDLTNFFSEMVVPYINKLDTVQNLFSLANSGAKGTPTNISQIMLGVGMQHNDGRFIERTLNGRITPYSHSGSMNLRDNGLISHALSDGMTPIEFFYSAVAGRRGKITQQSSTWKIGYAGKKINQINRDNTLRFDRSVRDNYGRIFQLLYGNSGFSATRLFNVPYPFNTFNSDKMKKELQFTSAELKKYSLPAEQAEKEFNRLIVGKKIVITKIRDQNQISENIRFKMPVNVTNQIESVCIDYPDKMGKRLTPAEIIDEVDIFVNALPKIYSDFKHVPRERVETSLVLITIYIRSCLASRTLVQKVKITEKQFQILLSLIWTKLENALSSPGSMVGMLAAYSLTQPSTQMVIDSFHVSSLGEVRGEGSKLTQFRTLTEVSPANVDANYEIFIEKDITPEHALNNLANVVLSEFVTNAQVLFLRQLTESKFDSSISQFFSITRTELNEDEYSHFVLRFAFDRHKLYHRKIEMTELKFMLEDVFSYTFVATSEINITEPFIYVYIQKSHVLNEMKTTECELEIFRNILNLIPTKNINTKGCVEHGMIKTSTFIKYDEETFEKKIEERPFIQCIGKLTLENIIQQPFVDSEITISSNVTDIWISFGVEAARGAFINELWKLMRSVAGNTNLAHIHLIADTVFYTGVQIPTTQEGAKRQHLSPVSLITFQKFKSLGMDFCRRGINADGDNQSFAVITGQRSKYGGTGDLFGFEVVSEENDEVSNVRELNMTDLFNIDGLDF